MGRISLIFLFFIAACTNDNDEKKEPNQAFQFSNFSESFKKEELPFSISDTALQNSKDTAALDPGFQKFIPDTLQRLLFKSNTEVKYAPLAWVKHEGDDQYFIVSGRSSKNTAALLLVFDKEGKFAAALPFLKPDADPSTTQVSSIDKGLSISLNMSKKTGDEVTDGKEVFAYSAGSKQFSLIMTDVLDDASLALINPIDTFAKSHPLAGDYMRGEKNLVSVRDGRNEKEINFFIHFEDKESACSGELKGTALFAKSNMAVYRQGGDPCVMELHFNKSTVTLKEVEGCGAHRELRCSFDGSFTRKKTTATKKPKKPAKK